MFRRPGRTPYLQTAKLCPKVTAGSLESRRQRGLFAPQVIQAVGGSFTAPGVDEKVVLASVGECNAAAAASYQLAVLRGDTVVVNTVMTSSMVGLNTSGMVIGAVVDFDGDGQSEVVLTSSTYWQDMTSSQASSGSGAER